MKEHLRIATLQLGPARVGDVQANIETIRTLLFSDSSVPDGGPSLDLLVLPEMITQGYCFSQAAHIQPLCEDTANTPSPPSLSLAAQIAQHFSSYVVIGFAEKTSSRVNTGAAAAANILVSPPFDARSPLVDIPPPTPSHPTNTRYYNSAALFDRAGNLIHTFRKHFLYEDDKVWAQEGPGFEYVDLPDLGRVCVAICMDLNPYEFEAPFDAFELASFCRCNNVDVLAMPMAWLLSKDPVRDEDRFNAASAEQEVDEHDISTINYWACRCLPLQRLFRRTILIAANRTGSEGDATFAGSSSIIQFGLSCSPSSDPAGPHHARETDAAPSASAILLSSLGTRQQGLQVVTV